MKKYHLLFVLLLLFSCKKEIESIEASSLTNLIYTTNTGNSGSTTSSLVGFGFDFTGYSDSTSGRSQIIDLVLLQDRIYNDYSTSTSPMIVSAQNLEKLLKNQLSDFMDNSYHVISLLKLARLPESVYTKNAFSYYSWTAYTKRYSLNASITDLQNSLLPKFKLDLETLSPKELVSKYGTHLLKQVYLGAKYEAIYLTETTNPIATDDFYLFENTGIYKRMKDFFIGSPGIIIGNSEINSNKYNKEQIIFNTTGGDNKLCGLINITDNNSLNISVDIDKWANTISQSNSVFIGFKQSDAIFLYDLLNESSKKEELKVYINQYIASKSQFK